MISLFLLVLYAFAEAFNVLAAVEWLRSDNPRSSIVVIPAALGCGGVALRPWHNSNYLWIGAILAVHVVLVVLIPLAGGAYRMTPIERLNRRRRGSNGGQGR